MLNFYQLLHLPVGHFEAMAVNHLHDFALVVAAAAAVAVAAVVVFVVVVIVVVVVLC